MLKIIEAIFSLTSFFILTLIWVLITGLISYYFNLILKANRIRPNPVSYSILLGVVLEVLLSAVSLLIIGEIPESSSSRDTGILSGLEKGYCFTVLISPFTCILGAKLGISKRRRFRKLF